MNRIVKNKWQSSMKFFLVLMTTFLLVTSSAFAAGGPAGGPAGGHGKGGEAAFEPGQLIVSVAGGGSDYSIQSTDATIHQQMTVIEAAGLNVVDSLIDTSADNDRMSISSMDANFKSDIINQMGYVYLVEFDEQAYNSMDKAQASVQAALKAKGLSVRYVEPNYTLYAMDVHPNQQWHYDMIKAPQAWGITTGSTDVKIAVLDTGVDNNHQNLQNFVDMSLAKSFVGGDTMDRQSHGTHVSGTIASYGSVSGVMQNASIVPVKVLGDDGSGSTYGIQQGILYAASIKADVVNMSLGGGGYSQGMDEACQTAVDAGVVVIAAAGNSGTGSISYPAAYSSVIAVGAVDANGKRASFSQYGTGLEVMAPGTNIYSTVPNNGYDSFNGTSMATPHVAGVAGLIRSANKSLTALEVRNIIKSTAVNAGPANEYGYGIVNAYEAVKAAGGNVEPPAELSIKAGIATNKDIYKRGESVTTTVTVLDQDNAPLQGATVVFTFIRPNSSSFTTTKTTDASGIAVNVTASSTSTALGTYTIQAEVTKDGYVSSTVSKLIKFTRYGY